MTGAAPSPRAWGVRCLAADRAHSSATAVSAARCSLPARFSFSATSTAIATVTAAAVTYAR